MKRGRELRKPKKLTTATLKLKEPDLLILRTDHDNGSQELVSWDYAQSQIAKAYDNVGGAMRQLAFGHPIRCTFATYQHRDFVEGWER